MSWEAIMDYLENADLLVISADGLEEAAIGVAKNPEVGEMVLVYSIERCLEILQETNDWTLDEAMEYFDFNTLGAYAGKGSPIFVHLIHDSSPLGYGGNGDDYGT
jgi:hypothetical protein